MGLGGRSADFPGKDDSAQVITALRTLGLGVFPFASFDLQGRLISEPNVDPDLKRELNEALASPDWKRLFSTLSLFDNPGHNASWLGFTLRKGASLVAVRSMDTLSKPASAGQWYLSLADPRNLLAGIQDAAGKAYVVKPSWIDAIRKILGLIGLQLAEFDTVEATEEKAEELSALVGLKTAIEFVLGVLEIANLFGRRHNVSCVVVWQYGYWKPPMTPELGKQWASIGSVVNQGGRNVAGVIWDPRGRTTWNWEKHYPWYGLEISPTSIHRAWYPSGRAVDAEFDPRDPPREGDPDAGPAPVDDLQEET
jgi:hypothetical protein